VALLVEAAAEGARVRRRRAHACTLRLVRLNTSLPGRGGDRAVRGDGAIKGEAHRGSGGGTAEVDTCGRGRAVEKGG